MNNSPFDLAPPNLYLSHEPTSSIFLFTDVATLNENYNSSPTTIPLPNQNTPYRGQGFGGGWQWQFSSKINAWHSFRNEGGLPPSYFRQGAGANKQVGAYLDLMAIKNIIKQYGPSPLFVLHLPNPNPVSTGGQEVMMTDFGDILSPRQSFNDSGGEVYPHTIPIDITLVEYTRYKVIAN